MQTKNRHTEPSYRPFDPTRSALETFPYASHTTYVSEKWFGTLIYVQLPSVSGTSNTYLIPSSSLIPFHTLRLRSMYMNCMEWNEEQSLFCTLISFSLLDHVFKNQLCIFYLISFCTQLSGLNISLHKLKECPFHHFLQLHSVTFSKLIIKP